MAPFMEEVMNVLRIIAAVIIWIPTVILFIPFVILFKLLSLVNGKDRWLRWYFLDVSVMEILR